MPNLPTPGNLQTVLDYHERTKHHLDRYARSPGHLDWDTQPNPFRRYRGAPVLRLELPTVETDPTYDSLFAELPAPAALTKENISRLFSFSLALSAWKQVALPDGSTGNRWSLRVDPSSGNLHPTEGYLVCGPVAGLSETPAVYHYAPFAHALEQRRRLNRIPGLPPATALIGITSIHWREAWKYGERAFRYCQHDCGHVIAAIALSAACLGWVTHLIDQADTKTLGRLLGVADQQGPEAEHPDCLLLLTPDPTPPALPVASFANLAGSEWLGEPNRLSPSHHAWPVIEEVSAAVRSFGYPAPPQEALPTPVLFPDRDLSAHQMIRQRRSAVAMDGKTTTGRDTFYRILVRAMPQLLLADALPWMPAVALVLFVHRVEGLPPGLYAVPRHPSHEASLRSALREEFLWETPGNCPDGLPLRLLVPAHVTDAARTVSCHQEIAADGVFAVAMLARFDETLRAGGPTMYPRLFWEAGAIGQILYLEAEAAGLRGTGIGCFFDDAVHQILGITDSSWQSLYHFTIGGPVEDSRIQTVDAYEHLSSSAPPPPETLY